MDVLGIGTMVAGLANAGVNWWQGERNYEQQQDVLKWQKKMQLETWAREDNAVARRARDLKNAGINPLLAAGQAASASSPIKVDAPQRSYNPVQKALEGLQMGYAVRNAALDIKRGTEEIARVKAETNAIQMQAEKARQEAESWRIDNMHKLAWNPLSEKKLSQEVIQNELMNPLRVSEMLKSLQGQDLGLLASELDNEIRKKNISLKDIDAAKGRVEVALKNQEVSLNEKNLIAKQIAIETAQVERDLRSHEFRFYEKTGGVPSQTMTPSMQYGGMTGGRTGSILGGILGEWLGKRVRR